MGILVSLKKENRVEFAQGLACSFGAVRQDVCHFFGNTILLRNMQITHSFPSRHN